MLRHRVLTMLAAAGTLAATVYLYGLVPKGFIPNQDTGQLSGSTEAPQDISFDAMVQRQQQVAARDRSRSRMSRRSPPASAGGGGVGGGNAGRVFMRLKPREAQRRPRRSRSSSSCAPS